MTLPVGAFTPPAAGGLRAGGGEEPKNESPEERAVVSRNCKCPALSLSGYDVGVRSPSMMIGPLTADVCGAPVLLLLLFCEPFGEMGGGLVAGSEGFGLLARPRRRKGLPRPNSMSYSREISRTRKSIVRS